MKHILFSIIFASLAVSGCASLHSKNEPVAKGKWIAINPYGYVPPNTDVYFKKEGLGNTVVTPTLTETENENEIEIEISEE